jgi:DNA-directed RNA polymerase subunit L
MIKNIKIESFKQDSLNVHESIIKDKTLAGLIPTTLIPQHIEVVISGINNAESNAIRRTMACELPVIGLECEYSDIQTDDMHIIPELIQKRILSIPVDQTIPLNTTFSLEYLNKTPVPFDIKTSQLKTQSKNKYFNDTITILTLAPEKYIKISNIKPTSNYGFIEGHGMNVVAVNTASICMDVDPINVYERIGVSSHITDPKVWKLSFNTNGTMDPKKILIASCNNIIERITAVNTLIPSINAIDDQYILIIYGESHTIGNLLTKNIVDMYPAIKIVTYNVNSVERSVTIRIRCDDEINIIYKNVINKILAVYKTIISQLSH